MSLTAFQTAPKRRQPLTVKAIIDEHRANPDLKLTYPLAKTGIVLGSKVHSGAPR